MLIVNTQLILHTLLASHISSKNNRRLTKQAFRAAMRHISGLIFINNFIVRDDLIRVTLLSRRIRRNVILNNYKLLRFLRQAKRRTRLLARLSITVFRMANHQERIVHVSKHRYMQAPVLQDTRRAIRLFRPFRNAARGTVFKRQLKRVNQRSARVLTSGRTADAKDLGHRGTRRSVKVMVRVYTVDNKLTFQGPP